MTSGHFWATRSAAAHRNSTLLTRQPQQEQQTNPHRRHLAETHHLDSCSTFCPPPSPDVRGTGHLEHPPCLMFLLHRLDVTLKSLWMKDVL